MTHPTPDCGLFGNQVLAALDLDHLDCYFDAYGYPTNSAVTTIARRLGFDSQDVYYAMKHIKTRLR